MPRERSVRPSLRPTLASPEQARSMAEVDFEYRGNPLHKKFPEDYKLTPPAKPTPGKTLCDKYKRISKMEAEGLLRMAIRKGIFDPRLDNGFPRKVWAVDEEGYVYEARLDDREHGTYHGYPLASTQRSAINTIQEWWRKR